MTRRPQSTPMIVANWKMQFGIVQAHEQLAALNKSLKTIKGRYQTVVCPSYLSLPGAKKFIRGGSIKLGAQNVFWDERGAYTGEVSPLDLNDMGVEYVILGHSERRQLLRENDVMVGRKVISAVSHNLTPILCVGESAHDRNDGRQDMVVRYQISNALKCVPPPRDGHRIYIAYEPIWAVGTGEPASAEQALEMLGQIHQTLYDLYSVDQVASSFRILYGGSVDPDNVSRYVGAAGYHGALVGNASLDHIKFVKLITNIVQKF
jgi:triosephosphate isomerase (TIM)